MGFQDVAFLHFRTSCYIAFLKIVTEVRGYLGTITCLISVVYGKQGHASFTYFYALKSSFCIIVSV